MVWIFCPQSGIALALLRHACGPMKTKVKRNFLAPTHSGCAECVKDPRQVRKAKLLIGARN